MFPVEIGADSPRSCDNGLIRSVRSGGMHGEEARTGWMPTDDLETMAFEDGRLVLYDPGNPEAWLLLDRG